MKISKIELLSCNILNENEHILRDIDLLTKGLFKEIGWHYYIDLSWVINWLQRQDILPGATILDAGAGNGLLQYLLSFYGYNVVSVDFSPRTINLFAKLLFKFERIKTNKRFSNSYISHLKDVSSLKYKIKRLWYLFIKGHINIFSFGNLVLKFHSSKIKPGKITIYQADMRDMKEIPSNSVDAIVSISAIEHMEIDSIKCAINEFIRILKNNKPMIITTSASKLGDWYHQPSEGWCFSYQTLSALFKLGDDYSSTFNEYDNVFSEYKNNSFLKKKLASIYFVSDKNGMPNGIWNPQYVPVGILTYKENV